MNNHPNRSKSAGLRHVVYSVASHNSLSFGGNVMEALDRASLRLVRDGVLDTDFIVIFTTRSRDEIDRFDAGRWPRDAKIVFRGANGLAQRFRAA